MNKIYILEVTEKEAQDIYYEMCDIIMNEEVIYESYVGAMPDCRCIRLEMTEAVEKYDISMTDVGVTLEIVTTHYIFLHDIETANEVRCLL